ncbi:MAG: hypothetical protein RJA44_427 [Pseudomonadota bacterium]|jgi:type IV fimbrial biogenesis protein FimT
MLKTARPAARACGAGLAGLTLIELLVTLTMLALMLIFAVPALSDWLASTHVRGVAEQLEGSLRLAQAEAIRRNRQAVLVLTAQTPSLSAAPSDSAPYWLVRSLPLLGGEVATDLDFIQDGPAARSVGVNISGPALLCFNSLGRQVSNNATGLGSDCHASSQSDVPLTYLLSAPAASRRWQVQVYLGGRIRLCDPSQTLSDSSPEGC